MPLTDLLVVELASVLAGPSVGMFFAEHGARVVKVEAPTGDVTRRWPLATEDPADDRPAYFCAVNWGKQSVILDLAAEAGRDALHRLVEPTRRRCARSTHAWSWSRWTAMAPTTPGRATML